MQYNNITSEYNAFYAFKAPTHFHFTKQTNLYSLQTSG